MTHVTCRLTAKNWDKLGNPTLGYRAWATFFNVWLVADLSVVFLSVDCGSVSGFVCLFVCVFLLLRA